jgi:uncharacterized iron-regulated membrane protein
MHMSMSGMSMPMMVDYSPIDRLIPAVVAQQLAPPVLIAPPSQRSPHWSARSDTDNRPQRVDLVLDATHGTVLKRNEFSQRPLLDRVIGYGIAIHEGQLFPPLNQILGVFTALGLMTLCSSAVVMWWRRRPEGLLGAPPATATVTYPRTLIVLLACLGLFLPLLGLSMIVVLLVERFGLRRMRGASAFLGLSRT